MTTEDTSLWRRAKEVLHRLEELSEGDRRDAIERLCGGDAALRSEVSSLLAASAPERDVLGRIGRALDEGLPGRAGPARWLGGTVGGFRVVEAIGRGAMGFVYRGESLATGRSVAIKLLDRRLASDHSVERFDLEREGLDRLDHPGIARLLSMGTTSDGDPFYVMEYVEGFRVDAYADELRRSVAERVRLLLAVCPAVAHAHAHGIIHRDIKPSNILVRASGEPCLLDFGIAKLLDAEEGGSPGRISLESPAFTPFYSSPEHLVGDPVSPASDVYSLGALGYKLLAGRHPRLKGRRQPHTLADTFESLGPKAPAVASARGATVEQLRDELSGSLEGVMLRACDSRPEVRHPSVDAFAADLAACIE